MSLILNPIGVLHTPFEKPEAMPIQGALRRDIEGKAEVFPEFCEGLKDVDGFSHLIFLYYFHQSKAVKLISKPFMDDIPRGLFAIRGPNRPNPIGMTVIRLLKRDKNILHFAGVDMVNGTPLLDIKPYFTDIDSHPKATKGWAKDFFITKGSVTLSDNRFTESKK